MSTPVPSRPTPWPTRRPTRRPARRVLAAMLAGLSLAGAGCSVFGLGDEEAAVQENARYDGPEITAGTASGNHALTLAAPSGGWNFTLDRIEEQFGHRRVLMTARRPNPAFMQTQALTEHTVRLAVEASEPIRVYARVLDFGASGEATGWKRVEGIDAAR